MAILIRPNIAPLAGIVGLVLLLKAGRSRHLSIFVTTVMPATILIAALNTYFFGSALSSGYGPLESLYSLDRVGANLSRYGGWLLSSQTPLVLLALVSPWAWPGAGGRDPVRTALIAVAFPALVLALYLPYYVYDQWWYLRFLLPAYPLLSIGVAGVLVTLARRAPWPRLRPWLPWLLVVPVAWHGLRYSREPFGGTQTGDQRYVRMIEYVPRLPGNAVFVSLTHSGTIHYYTGRDVLRWEGLYERARLDAAVDYLRDRGFNVYLVVDYGERAQFEKEFAATRTAAELTAAPARDLGDPIVYAVGGSERPPAR